MAKPRVSKTSSAAYKKQTDDLVSASKKLPPVEAEEEENEVSLLKKEKWMARPSLKTPTVARPVVRQSTITTRVIIKDKDLLMATMTPVSVIVSVDPVLESTRKKRPCFDKEVDLWGQTLRKRLGRCSRLYPLKPPQHLWSIASIGPTLGGITPPFALPRTWWLLTMLASPKL